MNQNEMIRPYYKISNELKARFEEDIQKVHDYNIKIKSSFNWNYLFILILGILFGYIMGK